jgi:hypothetical protein
MKLKSQLSNRPTAAHPGAQFTLLSLAKSFARANLAINRSINTHHLAPSMMPNR